MYISIENTLFGDIIIQALTVATVNKKWLFENYKLIPYLDKKILN